MQRKLSAQHWTYLGHQGPPVAWVWLVQASSSQHKGHFLPFLFLLLLIHSLCCSDSDALSWVKASSLLWPSGGSSWLFRSCINFQWKEKSISTSSFDGRRFYLSNMRKYKFMASLRPPVLGSGSDTGSVKCLEFPKLHIPTEKTLCPAMSSAMWALCSSHTWSASQQGNSGGKWGLERGIGPVCLGKHKRCLICKGSNWNNGA